MEWNAPPFLPSTTSTKPRRVSYSTVDGRDSIVRRYMLVVASHFIFLGAATTLPATMCWLPGVPKSNDEEEE